MGVVGCGGVLINGGHRGFVYWVLGHFEDGSFGEGEDFSLTLLLFFILPGSWILSSGKKKILLFFNYFGVLVAWVLGLFFISSRITPNFVQQRGEF